MHETFSWSAAYLKSQFKFPWKIAEFVVNGERLPTRTGITHEEFDLITKCWIHQPKQRSKIDHVVQTLSSLCHSTK